MDKPITNQRLGLQMTSLTDKNFVFVNPKEMLEMSEGLFAQYFIGLCPIKDFS